MMTSFRNGPVSADQSATDARERISETDMLFQPGYNDDAFSVLSMLLADLCAPGAIGVGIIHWNLIMISMNGGDADAVT